MFCHFGHGHFWPVWRYTKDVVCAAKALSESCFVAAVGCNVVKYQLAEGAKASKASAAGSLGSLGLEALIRGVLVCV